MACLVELLYTDDLVLLNTSEERLKAKLAGWRYCLSEKGMKINVTKTKVMARACEVHPVESSNSRAECVVVELARTPFDVRVAVNGYTRGATAWGLDGDRFQFSVEATRGSNRFRKPLSRRWLSMGKSMTCFRRSLTLWMIPCVLLEDLSSL